MLAVKIAGVIDIGFFIIFYYLGSPILAWVNVFSVLMYVSAFYAIKNRKNKLGATLIWSEVVIHSTLGTLLIGWGSGFQYFFFIFIPALCVTLPTNTARMALLAFFGFCISLGSLGWVFEPIQPIHPDALRFVNLFNLSVVFLLFCSLAFYYIKTVKKAQQKLHVMATTDSLTELLNRRYMRFLVNREIQKYNRSKDNIGVMLIDIDHFKSVNDSFGHDVGDEVLTTVAKILRNELKEYDLISRWGGEEFLIVLPGSDLEKTQDQAEHIRKAIEQYGWQAELSNTAKPTVTVGVSEVKHNEEFKEAIARADKALYIGKHNGRNRVETSAE